MHVIIFLECRLWCLAAFELTLLTVWWTIVTFQTRTRRVNTYHLWRWSVTSHIYVLFVCCCCHCVTWAPYPPCTVVVARSSPSHGEKHTSTEGEGHVHGISGLVADLGIDSGVLTPTYSVFPSIYLRVSRFRKKKNQITQLSLNFKEQWIKY